LRGQNIARIAASVGEGVGGRRGSPQTSHPQAPCFALARTLLLPFSTFVSTIHRSHFQDYIVLSNRSTAASRAFAEDPLLSDSWVGMPILISSVYFVLTFEWKSTYICPLYRTQKVSTFFPPPSP